MCRQGCQRLTAEKLTEGSSFLYRRMNHQIQRSLRRDEKQIIVVLFPLLSVLLALCHFKALPQNTQWWAIASLLTARLVCHVMYFCYIWDCQQSCHVLIGQKYQWKLNMPKTAFFRNVVQVNKMMQNGEIKIRKHELYCVTLHKCILAASLTT